MVQFRLIGILTTFNKHDDRGFTAEDQRLLTIIAGQSAQVIETTHP
jgi:GAF domain-containing protein